MPEKPLEEINPKARDLFLKGRDALERKNYSYAINLLISALNLEPDFILARRYLRAAQSNKFKQAGGSPVVKKTIASIKFAPRLAMARMNFHKKPSQAMKLAEEFLCEYPTSAMAFELLADAASIQKLFETAVLSMESMVETMLMEAPPMLSGETQLLTKAEA